MGLCYLALQIRKCACNSVSVKKDVYPSKETYKRNKPAVLIFLAIPRCVWNLLKETYIHQKRRTKGTNQLLSHFWSIQGVCEFFQRDVYPSKETYKKYIHICETMNTHAVMCWYSYFPGRFEINTYIYVKEQTIYTYIEVNTWTRRGKFWVLIGGSDR